MLIGLFYALISDGFLVHPMGIDRTEFLIPGCLSLFNGAAENPNHVIRTCNPPDSILAFSLEYLVLIRKMSFHLMESIV